MLGRLRHLLYLTLALPFRILCWILDKLGFFRDDDLDRGLYP